MNELCTRQTANDRPVWAGAVHESAHVLAYMALGKTVSHVDMYGAGGFTAPVAGSLIDDAARAQTAMVGPVVEAFFLTSETRPNVDAATLLLGKLAEMREDLKWDPDIAAEWGDHADAGPLAEAMLPWSLTLVTSNWTTLERMADHIVGRLPDGHHGRVRFQELVGFCPDGPTFDAGTYTAWADACAPWRHAGPGTPLGAWGGAD
ncbi:hypothetical protein [Micrococcus yunnanensis]|uniref:hypothetical protein n=1 Tax=Micrococcus yunnanensis TaxID=566027 RepID=UPI001F33065F|nr:hypothetical protein [Micrococcus yunnanensis]MCF8559948.1 hypothetical protein [Micrococcus yunnanensis]